MYGMSGRTLVAGGPTVSDEQIEQARARPIVDYVKSCDVELKKRGRKQQEYWALCPFHDEKTPSFAVNAEKNAFFCHGCGAGGDMIDFTMQKHGIAFLEAVRLLAEEDVPSLSSSAQAPEKPLTAAELCPSGFEEVGVYPWPDESGTVLFETVRYEHLTLKQEKKSGKPRKTFRARRPMLDRPGLYIAKRGDVSPVVFRKDRLAARPGEDLHWAEGEEHALGLERLGFLATTTASGAQGVKAYSAEELRWAASDRNVILHEDYDAEGKSYAEFVSATIAPVAKSVRIVPYPEFGAGGDILDFIKARASEQDVQARVDATPHWKPPSAQSKSATDDPKSAHLKITSLANVAARETEWLWKRRIARGKLQLCGGHAGDGKSTLIAEIAAIGSVGGKWPDGSTAPRFRSLFVLGEDALDDTLRPRLDAHHADVDQIYAIEAVLDEDGRERFLNIEKHLPLLEDAILEYHIDAVFIDPLTTIMPGRDRNAEGDTRDSLTPLIKLAERSNVAVLGIAHVGKPSVGQRTAAQRILGATAFHAMARLVWMTAPANDGQMALGVVKSNLAMKPDTLLWSRAEDGPISWHGVSQQSVDDLLQGAISKAPRADAEGWLRELLAGGSRLSAEVQQLAKAEGFSFATLRRAADLVGVEKFKSTFDGPWCWKLPNGKPQDVSRSEDAHHDPSEQLGESTKLLTPRSTQVSNFATSKMLNGQSKEHLHETTPILVASEPSHAVGEVAQSAEVAHMSILRGEQLRRCVDCGAPLSPESTGFYCTNHGGRSAAAAASPDAWAGGEEGIL